MNLHENDLPTPEIKPDGWDYLPLMGAIHVPLAALSLGLQGVIFGYLESQNVHLSTPEMWGIIAAGHSLNMLMELYTLSKYDATANVWAMTLSQTGKVPDWLSVLSTYAINTTLQTFSSPVNIATIAMAALGGDNRVMTGLISQATAGMLTTIVPTALLISETLNPVVKSIHVGRTKAKEFILSRLDKAGDFLESHADNIKWIGRSR